MNFYDFAVTTLRNSGMFDNQIQAVMNTLTNNPAHPMRGRWSDDMSGYPPAMQGMTAMEVKNEAFIYIMDNAPLAWFAAALAPGASYLSDADAQRFVGKFFEVRAEEMEKFESDKSVPMSQRMMNRIKEIQGA